MSWTNESKAWIYLSKVVEGGGWVMARQGETFVALYSHQPAVWTESSEYRDREVLKYFSVLNIF